MLNTLCSLSFECFFFLPFLRIQPFDCVAPAAAAAAMATLATVAAVDSILFSFPIITDKLYSFPAISNRSFPLFNAFICSLNEQTSIYILLVSTPTWPSHDDAHHKRFVFWNCTNFACLHKKQAAFGIPSQKKNL